MKKLVLKIPLKKGSSGEEVEILQSLLVAIKARPKLKIDGIFGPNTKKAVCHFQKLRYGAATGIIDKTMADALNALIKLPNRNWPEMNALDWGRRRQKHVKLYGAYETQLLWLRDTYFKKYDDGTKEVGKLLHVLELCYTNLRRNRREYEAMSRDTAKAQVQFDKLLIKGKLVSAKALLKSIHANDATLQAQEKEIGRLFFKAHKLADTISSKSSKAKAAA